MSSIMQQGQPFGAFIQQHLKPLAREIEVWISSLGKTLEEVVWWEVGQQTATRPWDCEYYVTVVFSDSKTKWSKAFLGNIALVADNGPELVTFPKGSQVFSNTSLQQQETLWHIAKVVAERDSIDYNDGGSAWICPFCNGYQTDASRLHNEPFVHQKECIVTKARELMEWKKQQPQVTIQVTEPGDK